jgi:hypothetical protein
MAAQYFKQTKSTEDPAVVAEESLKALGRDVITFGSVRHKILGLNTYLPFWLQNIIFRSIVFPLFFKK